MQKKEWRISLCILSVLALIAAGFTAFVLFQHRPMRVEAFENRYLQAESIALEKIDGMEVQAIQDRLKMTWQAGTEPLQLLTEPQAITMPCTQWQLDLAAGGAQNTIRKDQWGYRVWLELRTLKENQILSTDATELFFEAIEADRARLYTLCTNAQGADAWQVCVTVEPIADERAEGSMILEHWEVWGK